MMPSPARWATAPTQAALWESRPVKGEIGILLAPLGPLMPCTLLPGGFAILVLRTIYKRRVGGVTGDLLGAASELIETLYLALAAALLPELTFLHPFEAPSW